MTTRREVVEAIKRAAFAAELKDDPRAKAWSGAAWPVSQAEGEFEALVEEGLEKIPGVDADLAELGRAVFKSEASALLTELEADLPEGLFALGELKGLGAKKVKALWTELGIASLGELEYAIEENRLVSLKGFGAKTQEKVAQQLEAFRETEGLMRRDEVAALIADVIAEAAKRGVRAAVAGKYRRGAELTREALFVVAGEGADLFADEMSRRRGIRALVAGEAGFGAALVQNTGSEAHLEALRALGSIAGETEQEVYESLGLHWTPPERREASVPLVRIGSAAPELVRQEDLRGALHNHTSASDGTASLADMRAAAAAMGLEYLGISEHSQAAAYARGLAPKALRDQAAVIAKMNADGNECTLLSGVESDILEDGALDYEDDLLASLDIVVASVHRRFKQDPAAMTERMCRAARHRQTALVGHPTGRLLLAREESGVDMDALLDACLEGKTAIELNANPHRLDLSARHAAMAKERGVLVSIGADAHSTKGLENLQHGIAIARRAGLRSEDVLNAMSLEALRAWRQHAGG